MTNTWLSLGASGDAVAHLQSLLEQLGFQIPTSEVTTKSFGPGTQQAVQKFQQQNALPVTGTVDDTTTAKLAALAPASPVPTATSVYTVQGALVFDNGLPATGITVRIYNIGFGGQDAKLGESKSDLQGNYSIVNYFPPTLGAQANLQVRVVDPTGKEVTISTTLFNAQPVETLNLVVPLSVQPLASEYQRLSADMNTHIGGIAMLAKAVEGADRQDLTYVNQSTSWDARVVTLAAYAAQHAATTGLGQDALYALFRVGLPTDPSLLAMVPASTVQQALTKANESGVVSLTDQQITAAANAFAIFAAKTHLAMTAPGAVSTFGEMLSTTLPDPEHQAAFTNLYFTQGTASDFWAQAAKLNIPAPALASLKLQGKLLHLTYNNAPLAQKLQQDIGSNDLSQLANKDYHRPETWQSALTALAGNGGDAALQKLIPAIYPGDTTADRLTAYSADLARKVRIGVRGVTARMIETKELPIKESTAAKVIEFLRAAEPAGYKIGQTPLNALLKNSPAGVPSLDTESTQSLKQLVCLSQVTPSSESLAAALKLGFTSAFDIARYTKEEFANKFANAFPPGEAAIVYGQAQTVSSVTFNFFALAKQLDRAAPVYALSGSDADRQNAKDAIVQQFPSMQSLFGNLDFCQCEDCRSVLSPAAYFVDLLEFLRTSGTNAHNYTPLDVLIGKDTTVPGRRPDLGALPLTCENTNTAMPYIDLVNEIFEYYIANSHLDAKAAYDTGNASTADLTAEPQHILPSVYKNQLKTAAFPLNLPFDLWIETVRGFLNYFNVPLAQVLYVLRPADTLELFTDVHNYPYYQAQILSESLGISPSEYGVLTVLDPVSQIPFVQNWFSLYGYANEATALSELKSARKLAQSLGLTYQELTDLVATGFLNPALYPLIFQFRRFGIELSDAFSYTGQPGYPALSAQAKTDFEAKLNTIQATYKSQNPSSNFVATTWLTSLLPANYSKRVLVLDDPDAGCDFSGTTLQYADGSAATSLDYLKFNLFTRLWKKLGWSLDETDRALQLFFPANLPPWNDPGFAAAFSSSWKTALVYLAHLDELNTRLAPSMGRAAILPLWASLPVQGDNSLYAQLFLTSSVLNGDWAFEDPAGQFPAPLTDLAPPPPIPTALSAHLATIQGVLGLTADEITDILGDAGSSVTTVTVVVNGNNVTVPSFTLTNFSICYRYSTLAKCLQLSVSDLIALKAMSGIDPFQPVGTSPISVLADDVLYNHTLLFVKEVATVQNSGFSVEDLKYLLRQQFDPVGKYQSDPNVLTNLVQTMRNGLRQIQTENAVPSNLTDMAESLIDQTLSSILPAPILKSLFTLLTDSQTFTASQTGVPSANQIDASAFAQESEIAIAYDAITQTQTVTYKGLLLNWKKSQLEQINSSPLFSGLLDQLQSVAQQVLAQRVGDLLGAWASLAEYEAVQTGVTTPIAGNDAAALKAEDSALTLSYDQSNHLQWLGYRGILTDAKKNVLTSIPLPPPEAALLAGLLGQIQQQIPPTYRQLIGSVLAMWVNSHTYVATQPAAGAIDSVAFFQALNAKEQDGTIAEPGPALQFSYANGIQTVACTGVLADALRLKLEALPPASALLGSLLQDVRNQAVQQFQFLASSLLTVSGSDLDTFSAPFIGVDFSKQQKQVKAQLVQAFLPLRAQKLSRQFVLQTLASSLGADPVLMEALLTDAALLSDPASTGKSLLEAFLAVGKQGISAAYYSSANGSGTAQASGIAATTDTADPTNTNPPTGSAHFEGYLQVPTDGPYRFFAELRDAGAGALFHLDSPDPTALFENPIISPTPPAASDGTEVSQFVQLKGGVAYHFTLDFSSLGTHGASLLIQGESLPKGALSQIVLCPQQAIVNFARAQTLLAKAIQILQVTGLDVREISYLAANAGEFSGFNLGSLPTLPADDSPSKAAQLFAQFLTLVDYAALRKGPAGSTDALVDVFQAARQSSPQEPNTPWTMLANLTRRNSKIVHDVAAALGPDSHFQNNIGIRRVWDALQLVQMIGIPVTSLAASTWIASPKPPADPSPELIAASFKNAVQAQYTVSQWRPIAQSVFDKLRQKKRDALVSYLVHTLNLENSNQLFEYFLVDPGMEPVVQTSRLRLAMSSVQTFVQRCLMNLENANTNSALNVAPSAIDADWWEWMKRYRVWQANREIFLFPENWMEPELRLDKSDLFQTLESTLLQGDVTSDLVEDTLLTYLKGLDARARLDIVATYLEQNVSNASLSTLHVLGRTYSHPHKYFYRTYASGTWSAWQAVTGDIDGDHIVLAMWRGRLNVFWVTFISQQQGPQNTNSDSRKVTDLSFGALAGDIFSARAQQQYKLQLHWTEYFQGKWSNPIASDVNRSRSVNVKDGFDPSMVYIRVSKEVTDNGGEGAVDIHLDFPVGLASDWDFDRAVSIWDCFGTGTRPLPNYVFRVTSKNCDPVLEDAFFDFAPMNPYVTSGVDATLRTGSGSLTASFQTNIASSGTSTTDTEPILQSVNSFALLASGNPVVPSPFLDPGEPLYQEAGSLVSPFFYRDSSDASTSNELTFFVQPSLTEKTLVEWEGWAIQPSTPLANWTSAELLQHVPVVAQVPTAGPVQVGPIDPVHSVFAMQNATDWLTSPATTISYGTSHIGKNGRYCYLTAVGVLFGGAILVGNQGLSLNHLRAINSAADSNSRAR